MIDKVHNRGEGWVQRLCKVMVKALLTAGLIEDDAEYCVFVLPLLEVHFTKSLAQSLDHGEQRSYELTLDSEFFP